MQEDIDIRASSGVRLRATLRFEGEPTGGCVMCAGFTSRRSNRTNTELSGPLVEAGVAVVTVDLSGHGDSDGDIAEQTIVRAADEILDVLAWSRRAVAGADKWGLLGSSFSGSASIIAAGASPDLACLALKSPVPDYVEMRRAMLGDEAMANWRSRGSIVLPDGVESNYGFVTAAESQNLYAGVRRISCPVLVVQGDQDEQIPRTQSERLRDSLNPTKDRFVWIPATDHGYSSNDGFELMKNEVLGFLRDQLA